MQPYGTPRRRLGDILIGWGKVSEADVARALAIQRSDPNRPRLGEVLIREHLCDEQTVAAGLAERHGLHVVDLDRVAIDDSVARSLDRVSAFRYRAVPFAVANGNTVVAVADPFDIVSADDLRTRYQGRVSFVVAMPSQVEAQLRRLWGDERRAAVVDAFVGRVTGTPVAPRIAAVDDEGAVGIVDQILLDATNRRASDVHIEPSAESLRVRFRIDGIMHVVLELPPESLAPIASRVKVISGLDVFTKRTPQDGRARVRIRDHDLDVRVSTVPTIHGENLVLRLMTSQKQLPEISKLGLSWEQVDSVAAIMGKPQGFIVVTGPTGSGKSTTLYSLLSSYVGSERHAITMEDPVELELEGVTQIQIDEAKGVSFPGALRAALRQDPDVVMVGEIRDTETANMAVSAALTGHLVLSTLHTLDGPSAVVRLVQLGVPKYLVADALGLVIAQRLLRRPCAFCSQPSMPDPQTQVLLGLTPAQAATLVAGSGCEMCGQTGYLGRVGAYELLTVTPRVRGVIHAGGTAADVASAASTTGYVSLQTAAVRLAMQGLTTADEVLRTIVAPAMDVAVE
ncbi:MAG: Flp pilus assembly complex ATPase component TadA [Actinobacteria bacterium]|nr:Flp pilus assembly complex ATPase component TadA [Actinomycetota bacterium]MCB9412689.1 Flp pilus assembly complex ATPase component TadA [Actinomycetota bacterium]